MPVVLVGVGLFILLSAFVAMGLAVLQHGVSQGIVGFLIGVTEKSLAFGLFTTEHVLKLDKWLTHKIGSHFRQVEHIAVGWVAGLATYVKIMALAPMNLAATSWAFGWWLVHTEIPRIARAHNRHAEQTAAHADAVAEAALKASSGVAKSHPGKVTQTEITRIERVAMPHAEEWSWINHHWKALTLAVTAPVTLPGVLGLPVGLKWFGQTRKQLRAHHRRLARLEKLIGVGVFAASMARVLGVSARCLGRNGNVGKVARGLCGLPTHLLNDLLGILADIWIIENVCVLLPFLETGVKDIGKPLVEALTVVGAGICAGSKAPGALRGSSANLPSPVLSGASSLV